MKTVELHLLFFSTSKSQLAHLTLRYFSHLQNIYHIVSLCL